eukprot:Colp12_sorted_trinity150504_noHs@25661
MAQGRVAFQGVFGAYSELVCRKLFPRELYEAVPRATFQECLQAVEDDVTKYAVIPVQNSHAERVMEVHLLLRDTKLNILAEHFESIHHCLVAAKGTKKSDIKQVISHPQALAQCQNFIRKNCLR